MNLNPHGALRLDEAEGGTVLEAPIAAHIIDAFDRGASHGLLSLGFLTETRLPTNLAFWQNFADTIRSRRSDDD